MKRIVFTLLITTIIVSICTCVLVYNGYIWFNNPDRTRFPIKGVDVSNHQGEIVWRKVKNEGVSFAYIKATEGKDWVDKYFRKNWVDAQKAGIRVGAYHFFTFSSSGIEQAKNFIRTVPKESISLPPVIDVEFGGNSRIIPRKQLEKELKDFIRVVNNYYDKEPVIYVLYDSYGKYIINDYKENEIWIRDIFMEPRLKQKRKWMIWQYCNRGRLDGIKGFVDLNVFNGSEEEYREFINR